MEYELRGVINSKSQRLVGSLNVYTMETGDGRELELAVVGDYICWRRVNDRKWIQLVSISDLEGYTPIKGVDYWTEEDQLEMIEFMKNSVLDKMQHNMMLDRDANDAHPISSITGLSEKLDQLDSDNFFIYSQKSASSIWHIVHNMNKYPAITIVDSANNSVVGEINYINLNEVELKFVGAFSGKAYLN